MLRSLVVLAAVVASAAAVPVASADTFSYTGDFQTYTVPAGVTALKVSLLGGAGGMGADDGGNLTRGTSGGAGGFGGTISGRIAVTPGETLKLFVGGRGGDAFTLTPGASGAGGPFTGGPGGTGVLADAGGGGGGGSSILRGDTPLIVAGGGGGGGGEGVNPPDPKDYITGAYGGNGGAPATAGESTNQRMLGASGGGGTNDRWTGGQGGLGAATVGAGGGGGGGLKGGSGGDAGTFGMTLGFFGATAGGGGGGGSNFGGDAQYVTHGVKNWLTPDGSITVTPIYATTTSLVQSAGTSSTAAPATLTATVANTTGSGTVDFLANSYFTPRGNLENRVVCQDVPLTKVGSEWRATCSTAPLGIGSHLVTARYSGSIDHVGSTSNQVQHDVGAATGVRFINPPATATYGQTITFKVAIDGSLGRGSVDWHQGPGCGGALSWDSAVGEYTTTCAVPVTTRGTQTVTVEYRGVTSSVPQVASSSGSHSFIVAVQPDYMTVSPAKTNPAVGEAVRVNIRKLNGAGTPDSIHPIYWNQLVSATMEGGDCSQVNGTGGGDYSIDGYSMCTPRSPGLHKITVKWTYGSCSGYWQTDNNPPAVGRVCSGSGSTRYANGILTFTDDCPLGTWNGNPRKWPRDCAATEYIPTGSATVDAIGPIARIDVQALNPSVVVGQPITLSATGYDAVGHDLGPVDATKLKYTMGTDQCVGRACIPSSSGEKTITGTYTSGATTLVDDATATVADVTQTRTMTLDGPGSWATTSEQDFLAALYVFDGSYAPLRWQVDGESVPGCPDAATPSFTNGYQRSYLCRLRITTPGRHLVSALYDAPSDPTYPWIDQRTVASKWVQIYGPTTALRVDGPAQLTAGRASSFEVVELDAAAQGLRLDETAPLTITPVSGAGGSATGASCTARSCSATKAGTYRVTAARDGMTDTKTVEVVPAAASRIDVTPASARIPVGADAVYGLAAFDAYGNPRGPVTDATATVANAAGTCTGLRCTSTTVGTHTVTFTSPGSGTATGQLEVFQPDATPPTVTLDALAARTRSTTPTFSGDGGRATGDLAAITVRVHSGTSTTGAVVQTRTASRDADTGRWSVAATTLAEGTYTAVATQSDTGGNTGTSTARTFTVDVTAPSVTLDALATRTADRTPRLTGTGGSAAGDGQVVVTIKRGTDVVQTLTTGPGAFALTPATLSDGTYTAIAEQSDDAGNPGASASRTFTVDGTKPALTLDVPPARTADDTPTFGGGAGTDAGDSPTVAVTVRTSGGAVVQTASATRDAGTGRWSLDAQHLADGAYTVQATQADDVANRETTPERAFVVDTTAPVVTLDPVDGSDATPALTGSAGRHDGDLATVTVRIYAGASATGSPVQTLTATRDGVTGRYAVDAATLAAGTYTAEATQADDLANRGSSGTRTFTVDTTPPSVALDAVAARTADSTPTFAGTAGTAAGDDATVTVRVYAGTATSGTALQTRTATRDGSTGRYAVDATTLAEGQYTAVASQTDAAGNSGTSAARTFVVDLTGPTLVLDTPAARTGDATPSFTGVRGSAAGDVASVTLLVKQGASVVQTLTATAASFTVTAETLADGAYTVEAAQADDAGNTTTTTPRAFTVDTAKPALTLDAPATPTRDATPALSGTGGRAAGDAGIVTVRIRKPDGTLVQSPTATVGSDGRWSLDAAALTDGTYTAVAEQSDDVGNAGTSAERTFTVDTTPPALTMQDVAARLYGTSPRFAGSRGTAAGDAANVVVTVKQGGTEVGAGPAILEDASWWQVFILSEGTFTVSAKQTDAAGNVTETPAQTFTLDATAPTPAIDGPARRVADSTPLVTGSASRATGDAGELRVRIYAGTSFGDPTADERTVSVDPGTGRWALSAPELPDGDYLAIAWQSDDVGHTGYSGARTFTVDTTPPAVTLAAVAARTGDSTPTLSGTGSGADGDVTLELFRGTERVQSRSAVVGSTGGWSVDTATLVDGTYRAVATQTDDLGNAGTSEERTFTVDTAAPTVTLQAIAARTSDATQTFRGTASRAPGDDDFVTVTLSREGATILALPATVERDGTYAVETDALDDDTYTATVTQADDLGHTAVTDGRTYTIDTTAPAVTLDAIAARSTDVTPTFAGAAGRGAGDDGTVSVVVRHGGDVVQTRTATVGSDGRYAVDAEALADGTYTATTTQSDDLEHTGTSDTRTFTVDTSAPQLVLDGPDARGTDTTPAITGVAGHGTGDGATVTLRITRAGLPVETLTAARDAQTGRFSATAAELGDGAYAVVAAQDDDLGHTGTSAERAFVVDTAAPLVPVLAPNLRTGDATPEIRGQAGTADGDRPEVTVTVRRGTDVLQTLTATVAGSGAWSVDAAHLDDGAYTLVATQSDDLGHTSTPTPHAFVVDTAAPDVRLDAPAARTADTTPALAGDAGRATGDQAWVVVRIYRGAELVQRHQLVPNAETGRYAVDAEALTDGTYRAVTSQGDDVGNAGTSDERTFTVDTAEPVVAVDALAARTGDATPALSGIAGRATGDDDEVTVTVARGDDVVQTLTATAGALGAWSVDAAELADGTYTVSAAQSDDVGNRGTSAPRTFTVDTTLPAMTLDAVAARTADATPALAGDGGTADGDEDHVTVVVSHEHEVVQTKAAAIGTGGRYAVDLDTLADGTYTAVARQRDDVGGTRTSDERTFTVDTAPPDVTLDALPARTGDATPRLSGSGTSATGDDDAVTIRVSDASGDVVATLKPELEDGTFAADAPELEDGTFTAVATQSDDVGNDDTSETRTFTVDTAQPTVTLEGPAARTGDATPAFAGAVSHATGDDDRVTVVVKHGADVVQTRTADVADGRFAIDAEALADGTYTAIARQSDDVGNTGESSPATFTVDTAAPDVTLGAIGPRTADTTPELAGSAGHGAGDDGSVTVVVKRGGDVVQTRTATVGAGGAYAVDATALADGTYSAVASQGDDLGHTGTSEPRTFTVDTTKPTVTLDAIATRGSDTTPALTGHAGTATGDDGSVAIRIRRGGDLVQTRTATVGAGGAYAVDAEALADGTYTAVASQGDDVGNGDVSVTRTFTVDTDAGAIVLEPVPARTADRTPALKGTVSRADGDADAVTIAIASAGRAARTVTAPVGTGGAFSVDAPELADGAYTAQASATDDLGHTATSAERAFTVDTAAPSVTLEPVTGTTFTGAASDAVGDEGAVTVRVYRGNDLLQTRRAERVAGRYAVDVEALAPGSYLAQATQADDVGNRGTSAVRAFTVAAPPAAKAAPGTSSSASSTSAPQLTNLAVTVAADGTATVTGTVSGPGTIDVLETIHRMGTVGRASALRPGPDAVTLGVKKLTVRAGAIRTTVRPTAAGTKTLVARRARGHQVSVNAYVTYTDARGRSVLVRKRVKVAQEKPLSARVLRVVDGDSLRVRAGSRTVTVDLLGVTSCAPDALAKLLRGRRSVTVLADPRHRVIRTARRMQAYVAAGTLDLGAELLRTGEAELTAGVAFARRADYAKLAGATGCR